MPNTETMINGEDEDQTNGPINDQEEHRIQIEPRTNRRRYGFSPRMTVMVFIMCIVCICMMGVEASGSADTAGGDCPGDDEAQDDLPKTRFLVFLDWDDTFCPTHECYKAAESVGGMKMTGCDVVQAQDVSIGAFYLLRKLIEKYGRDHVYIVTNGSEGWVQRSVQEMSERHKAHRPKISGRNYWKRIKEELLDELPQDHIVSARSKHEAEYRDASDLWKTLEFKEIAHKHFAPAFEGQDMIISIGDSRDEMIAAVAARDSLRFKQRRGAIPVHLVQMPLRPNPEFDRMVLQFAAIEAVVKALDKIKRESMEFLIKDFKNDGDDVIVKYEAGGDIDDSF